MAPTALAGRRHSQGVPRPAMARPPGETRVSRSRPEGMRRRENQPIHGPDSLGRSEAQPRCASTCDGSPSRRDSRKPKQARRDAPARKPAHPWPRQPWAVAANAKGSPDGQAVAPPGDRGRRARGGTRRGLRPLRATARRDGGPAKAGGGRQRNREARCRGGAGSRLRRTARRSHLRATVVAAHAAARGAASGRCVRLARRVVFHTIQRRATPPPHHTPPSAPARALSPSTAKASLLADWAGRGL
jgi:hypothetical protein